MKTALVYDRINKRGGAERILFALHKLFPDAPLYTSVYSEKSKSWAKAFNIKPSFLQKIEYFHDNSALASPLTPIAFESFTFDNYDLVISITSEAAKGIITKPGTTHVCYCLTPTRYLWSGYDSYFSNKTLRLFSKPVVSYLRSWDKIASQRADHYVSISNEVKKRVKKYYDLDSVVIYPPVMIEKRKNLNKSKGDYFLFVSRMSRFSYYKKADLVIDAFNRTGFPLIVIGAGPMLETFRKTANENISFFDNLTDARLAYYYENCKALVFPGLEDFGLVMAEAQTFGKPVIAYGYGGALDIIAEGRTGLFFEKQTVESLIGALKKFDEKIYNTAVIEKHAEKFSYDAFKKNFERFLEEKKLKIYPVK